MGYLEMTEEGYLDKTFAGPSYVYLGNIYIWQEEVYIETGNWVD